MSRLKYGNAIWIWVLPLLVALSAVPASAHAAWLGFRNDTSVPVVVQGTTMVNRQVRRTKPHLLYSREVAWDAILQAGNQMITVYDAKNPRLILYKGTIMVTGDLFYSLQVDMGKIKLVQVKPSRMPNRPPR
jgi:hypothetical protein